MITTDVWKDGRIVTFYNHERQKMFSIIHSLGDFNYITVWRLSMISDDDTILVEGRNLKITSLVYVFLCKTWNLE